MGELHHVVPLMPTEIWQSLTFGLVKKEKRKDCVKGMAFLPTPLLQWIPSAIFIVLT